MKSAVIERLASAHHLDRLFIGGEWVKPAGQARTCVIDPSTGRGASMLAAAVHALFFYVAISTFLLWLCDVLVGFLRNDGRFIRDLLTGMMIIRVE